MPRVFIWNAGFKHMPCVFNPDASVGRNATNNRLDVLLIQWLLQRFMIHNNNATFTAAIMATDVIKIDGICGKKTIAGIEMLEKINPALVKDGRIDPFPRGSLVALSKIQFLNELVGFTKVFEGKPQPVGVPALPQELYTHLYLP